MPGSGFNRRTLLAGLAAAGGATIMPSRLAFASPLATDKRFVFIIQRGAADGLSTLAPVGDPQFAEIRGQLAEEFSDVPRIGTDFALHPDLPLLSELFQQEQALFLNAIASPYRDRSHFDAQNVLETGGTRAFEHEDGWLNRIINLLPEGTRAMAVGSSIPAALRGPIEVSNYGSSVLPDADEDLMRRVAKLYGEDEQLSGIWRNALEARDMAMGVEARGNNFGATGELAANLLSGPNGARIAMIETGGWDTHVNQQLRLGYQFRGLNDLLVALRDGLGGHWANTLVLIATEFGRTAAINGTRGTDHGTASLAMLLGGAVNGGRVITDWPGLKSSQLLEGRDLKPTMSLGAAIAGAIGEHFGIDPILAMSTAFPGHDRRPNEGLIRT